MTTTVPSLSTPHATSGSWFIHLLSTTLLVVWLRVIVLDPLESQAIEMAHLDPTDIVAVPFSLERLCIFVGGSMAILGIAHFLQQRGPTITATYSIVDMVSTTIITYLVLVLCGAHPIHFFHHTALVSMYIATLVMTTTSSSTAVQQQSSFLQHTLHVWEGRMRENSVQFYTMCLTAIPFQILHILDWGAQVQRWPLPIVLGMTVGFAMGTFLGLLYRNCVETRMYKKM